MVKNLFARLTSLVLVVMLALTMVPSGIAFAEGEDFQLVLSADKYSLATGESVVVTVTMNGEFKDIAGLQIGVLYDPTAVTVDMTNTGTSRKPRYDNAIEAEWYAANDPYEYTGICEAFDLGIGDKEYKLDTTKRVSTILFSSQDGLTIDSACSLYGATSVEVYKVIFTATKAIDSVADVFAIGTDKESTDISVSGKATTTFAAVNIPKIDMTAVANVNSLITAIPEAVTYADKAKVEAAKTAYTALGDAEKALVTGADKITAAETAIATMETAIENVETLIAAIGDVIYPDSKTKIDAAREAYDALTDDAQKAAVENYTTLTDAEEEYANLEADAADKAAAEAVDAKIDAIGTVYYTEASKALIDEASTAYDELTPEQQALVTKKSVLDAASLEYAEMGAEVDAAEAKFKAFEGKTVTIVDGEAIVSLRQSWMMFDDYQIAALDAKLGYSSANTIEEYITAHNESAERVNHVNRLIAEIGTVTLESGSAIEEAEVAYDELLDVEKTYVTNYSILTTAREAYDALVEEATQNAANKAAAEAVEAKINAIGTVRLTEESRTLIESANEAYVALTPAQKTLVTNHSVLVAATDRYNELAKQVTDLNEALDALVVENIKLADKANIQKLRADYDALDDDQKALVSLTGYGKLEQCEFNIGFSEQKIAIAITMIDQIGTVTLDSGAEIEEAENAYNGLTQDEKGYVTNYSVLTAAKETYNTLKANKDAADEVIALIEALTPAEDVTKDNVTTVEQKANAARTSYENLADKTLVSDSVVAKLEAVEAACQTVRDDLAAAKTVEDLISAIGTVSLGSLAKIQAAEEAYDNLTSVQQGYVSNYDVLTEARNTYELLKADQDAVEVVQTLIAEIGEVTLDSLEAIEAAEAAYEELDDTLKGRVENYNVLVAARASYDALYASKLKVDAVIAQIDAIGEVTLGSLAKIQAAEAGYANLSDEEKENVTNYQTLLDARDEYDALKAAADKEEADREAALGVDELINALGVITLESETAVTAARAAYEALTEDQKAYVENLVVLEEAEAIIEGLKADQAAIDEVIATINEIGEVTYPDSKDAIDAAQAAYDNLADNLKDRVTNYGVLTAAQQKYASLEADYNAVQEVIALIDEIGEVEYTVAVKERIDAADEAYLALRQELRDEVTNADVLEAAKAKYEELKPTYGATEEPVTEYGDMHMVVFNNIPAGKKVTLSGVEAVMVEEDETVYYIILSSTALNPEEVVVEDGTSATFLMGDTDGNGTVTATDALGANMKSANLTVLAYDNDPMTYVRTDINGSGTITAYDALMIARIAAGVDVVTNFVAGVKDSSDSTSNSGSGLPSGGSSSGGSGAGGSASVPNVG